MNGLKSLIIFTLFILPLTLWSGEREGHGGGLAEQNIMTARLHLAEFITISLSSSVVTFDDEEREVLESILSNFEQELTSKIIFKSGTNDEVDFYIDGQLRVAKTYDYPGATIWINLDLIYLEKMGVIRPMSLTQAVTLLVHEYGHHQKFYDHSFLDTLGAKVAKVLQNNIYKLPLSRNYREVVVMTIDSNFEESFSSLLIRDSFDLIDVTKQLKTKLNFCRKGKQNLQEKLVGFYLENFHWGSRLWKGDTLSGRLVFNATIVCKRGNGNNYIINLGAKTLNLLFKKEETLIRFLYKQTFKDN
ncbi:MAG: hypothetical protein ISR65_17440 [Bacteriovoracaceae bacterium]|nr:hypothetical protein [Bacteriovoracaceae bacterium]